MFSISCPCRASAEEAIQKMQGKIIGQQVVRTSWGRNPAAKQVTVTFLLKSRTNIFLDIPAYFSTVDVICIYVVF